MIERRYVMSYAPRDVINGNTTGILSEYADSNDFSTSYAVTTKVLLVPGVPVRV